MKSTANKWLTVKPGVVVTDVCDPVIAALDRYFADKKKQAFVTSCLRTPESQLGIIRGYLSTKSLASEYPVGMKCALEEKIKWYDPYKGQTIEVYGWQPAWSKLLNIGVIINPPLAAECLHDYHRRGVNVRGKLIQPSPHFRGVAFDIGGAANGIADELQIVSTAMGERLPGMVSYLAEHDNNAIHIDCR